MNIETPTAPEVRYSVPPASGPVMARQQLAVGELPPEPPFTCAKLTEALAAARDRCKVAAKDSVNEHHQYRYTSADGIMATAQEALAGSGLALIPQRQALTVLAVGSNAVYALNRTFVLSHSSGEFTPLELEGWPVIPGNGRPLDKAFAIALTSSMSYMLQNLLQISRGDADDMATRDDSQAKPAKPAKPPADPTLIDDYAQRAEACREVECLRKVYDDIVADKRLNRSDREGLTRAIAELKKQIIAAAPRPAAAAAPAPGRGASIEVPF